MSEIGLIDVDSHNFPNLALMKISSYHKAQGDNVEWCLPFKHYDIVYQSKVFDDTYSRDIDYFPMADKIFKGGTGYFRREEDGTGYVYVRGIWIDIGGATSFTDGIETYNEFLPYEIEHIYPDYSLYSEIIKGINDIAYGFLTRGCPRACGFCGVAGKEGRHSFKVADLSEFWNEQKYVKLLDPNILACKQHLNLLQQLKDSKAYIDFTQGLDIRLTNDANIDLINKVRVKEIHFAWDNPKDDLKPYFEYYKAKAKHKPHGLYGSVYCITNFDSTMEENLYRIYTLRDMGFDPYVMIYDKPNAPQEIRLLQRWCNNKKVFRIVPDFNDFDRKRA